MLVDVNELLLVEQKKLKYLVFSIKPKNKHNLSLMMSRNACLIAMKGRVSFKIAMKDIWIGYHPKMPNIPLIWVFKKEKGRKYGDFGVMCEQLK